MALDFGNIKPETVDSLVAPKENPTANWIVESFETGTAKQVHIPATDARALVGMLNRAATELDMGVSVRVRVGGTEFVTNKGFWADLDNHAKDYQTQSGEPLMVHVRFQAKARVRRPRTAV